MFVCLVRQRILNSLVDFLHHEQVPLPISDHPLKSILVLFLVCTVSVENHTGSDVQFGAAVESRESHVAGFACDEDAVACGIETVVADVLQPYALRSGWVLCHLGSD